MMDRVSKLLEQMVGAIEGRPEIALTLASAMGMPTNTQTYLMPWASPAP